MDAAQVRVFFGPHETGDDALAMKEHFNWCDVYAPEQAGWNSGLLLSYRQLAKGNLETSDAFALFQNDSQDGFIWEELSLIEGSGKSIILIDVPHEHPIAGPMMRSFLDLHGPLSVDWDEAVAQNVRRTCAFAQWNVQRDWYIGEGLAACAREMMGRRILVRLGTNHTGAIRHARNLGLRADVFIQRQTVPFTLHTQMFRVARYGLMMPSVLVARDLLVKLLRQVWLPGGSYEVPSRRDEVLRKIAMTFDEEEIRSLWMRAVASEHPATVLTEAVAEHGFTIQVRA